VIGDPAEGASEVGDQVDAGREQQHVAHRPLEGDQTQDAAASWRVCSLGHRRNDRKNVILAERRVAPEAPHSYGTSGDLSSSGGTTTRSSMRGRQCSPSCIVCAGMCVSLMRPLLTFRQAMVIRSRMSVARMRICALRTSERARSAGSSCLRHPFPRLTSSDGLVADACGCAGLVG
jgi:hypothetical protein